MEDSHRGAYFFALPPFLTGRRIVLAARVIYWLLLALILVKAAVMRFSLPHWPVADPDSWGYIHPAFSKFAGGPFEHTYGRNLLYAAFAYLMLAIGRGIPAITVIQHLLGLGTGALLLASWARLRRFVNVMPLALHSLGGLALAAIYLLSQRPIYYEHLLRPEAITPFFAILNILLTLIFIEQRHGKEPSRRAAITAAGLMVNSAILATLKTSFMFTIWFSVVPVVIALADRRELWSRRIAVIAAAFVSAALMIVPEAVLGKKDPDARAFLPESLFSIHANLIVAQMDDDVARGDCGHYSCELVAAIAATTRDDMATSWKLDRSYRTFGFDPDYLFYKPDSMRSWPTRFFEGDLDRMLDFCMHYYLRTVSHQPVAMLQKVVGQLRLFYGIRNPSFTQRRTIAMAQLYQGSASDFERKTSGLPEEQLVAEFVRATEQLRTTTSAIRPPLLVRFANWTLSYLYSPILIAVVICALAAALVKRLRRSYGLFVLVILFLFSYNFGNSLGTAIAHSLHIWRYSEAQYSFTLLAECAGILFLIELTLRTIESLVRRVTLART